MGVCIAHAGPPLCKPTSFHGPTPNGAHHSPPTNHAYPLYAYAFVIILIRSEFLLLVSIIAFFILHITLLYVFSYNHDDR